MVFTMFCLVVAILKFSWIFGTFRGDKDWSGVFFRGFYIVCTFFNVVYMTLECLKILYVEIYFSFTWNMA